MGNLTVDNLKAIDIKVSSVIETSANGEETQTNGEEAPANGEETLTKSDGTPANGEEAPAKSDGAPANGEEAPAKSDGAPANGEETPADVEDATVVAKMEKVDAECVSVGVVGLGYVGLPLLCLFARRFTCVGLDINIRRINELKDGVDSKACVKTELFENLMDVELTNDWNALSECKFIIVAAPTPVDEEKKPDIGILRDICHSLGKVMNVGTTVVFESTVHPGVTEEACVPILEAESGLRLNESFFAGYSPERVNIGDEIHTISRVPKIVSGSDTRTLEKLMNLYRKGLDCDVVAAPSIKVAEAAKLYENVQRDILIALANQYSDYCNAEGIDIREVTRCAATKWNFSEVYPGLVGGHCIGVDPYYLLERAKRLNVEMPLMACGRSVNEEKARKVARRINLSCRESNSDSILILGAAYKTNTGDLRNSKILDIIDILSDDHSRLDVFDPLVDKGGLDTKYQERFLADVPDFSEYDLIAMLVCHDVFKELSIPESSRVVRIEELL